MKSEKRNIREAVQRLSGTWGKDLVSIVFCTVDSVDLENRTCECTPIDDKATTTISNVMLQAEKNDGFFLVPADDSIVLVGISNEKKAFVLLTSDIQQLQVIIGEDSEFYVKPDQIKGIVGSSTLLVKDKVIQFNDGTFGGLIKIDTLKIQYDAMIAAFKAACVAGFTALSGLDGGASLSAFNTSAASIQNLNKTTLENTTVTHGS